jgi:hypothetical protein
VLAVDSTVAEATLTSSSGIKWWAPLHPASSCFFMFFFLSMPRDFFSSLVSIMRPISSSALP